MWVYVAKRSNVLALNRPYQRPPELKKISLTGSLALHNLLKSQGLRSHTDQPNFNVLIWLMESLLEKTHRRRLAEGCQLEVSSEKKQACFF